ncbi:MAG: histidinol phosphate phosphatase [Planctomycetia bacterium]|nr:histidinol phosphate phosphatase [Planctomycetia bacterium]
MNADWRSRYEQAIDITRKAGKVAHAYYDKPLEVMTKGDESPVTIADRATEQFLREHLARAFPGDGFLGEEFGDTPSSTGYRWIMDPIDGTRSFVRGIPLWGTMVGLEYKGELVAGVIDCACQGSTWHAVRGGGAYRDDQKISVSKVTELSKANLFYSGLNWFVKAGREKQFLELVRRTERQRGYGDWYGFMLAAQGAGEAMIEYGVHSWDVAAVVPIVVEAGGLFSCWDGSMSIDRPDVIVSNGILHDQLLGILNG